MPTEEQTNNDRLETIIRNNISNKYHKERKKERKKEIARTRTLRTTMWPCTQRLTKQRSGLKINQNPNTGAGSNNKSNEQNNLRAFQF